MRNSLTLLSSLLLLTPACGAPALTDTLPAADALAGQCQVVAREFTKSVAAGRHIAVAVRVRGEDGKVLTEPELAARLIEARPGGETLVVARAGSGKSHLSWALQAQACAKIPTVHVAVAKELAPLYLTETAKKPALGRILAKQLGAPETADSADVLRAAFGKATWLLILDGGDELTASERKKLESNLTWLRSVGVQQHIVRLERPGYEGLKRQPVPDQVLELPDLTCAEVDSVLNNRWPEGKARADALAWLTRHRLDRKRAGEQCYYVHMATWRDVEVVADLAEATATGPDDLTEDPTRADVYGQWIINKLKVFGVVSTVALPWLDRIVSMGVTKATEPDLVLTEDRCLGAVGPDGSVNSDMCKGLLRSPVLKAMPTPGSFMFKNQTIADLLMARWLIERYPDCGTLAGATAAMGSIETMAMVASSQPGRLCLAQLVASECSQGVPSEQVAAMVDEALPLGSRDPVMLDRIKAQAASTCERAVIGALFRAP